jgi:CBS domain-containing protein
MKKVTDILSRKGKKIISVTPETTVIESLRVMNDLNIGSVIVLENDKYVGLMTERDYARKVALRGKSSKETLVADIMTTNLPSVHPSDTIDHCMQLFTVNNVRYLPVFEEEQLVGIVSINDVVSETILSQEETITSLKEYIYSNT